jgi:hypothetical protein
VYHRFVAGPYAWRAHLGLGLLERNGSLQNQDPESESSLWDTFGTLNSAKESVFLLPNMPRNYLE